MPPPGDYEKIKSSADPTLCCGLLYARYAVLRCMKWKEQKEIECDEKGSCAHKSIPTTPVLTV